MEQNEDIQGSVAFGAYLRKVREGRRLSLDAVEELSGGFFEKVTKSHLSRIENGLALPTFPRLMAMSQIYGVPIASLAERYEIELRREVKPLTLDGKSDEDVLNEAEALVFAGDFNEAMLLVWALLDRVQVSAGRFPAAEYRERILDLRLRIAICLIKLGRFEYAKTICEQVLSDRDLGEALRPKALQLFATASFRLQLYTVALLALDEVGRHADSAPLAVRLRADVWTLRGNVEVALGRFDRADTAYRTAVELYRLDGNSFEAANACTNLAVALIGLERWAEARTLLTDVLASLESGSNERPRALAFGNMAVLAYREGNLDEAEGFAMKSNAIARPREYSAIVFRNCFYLWKIAGQRGDAAGRKLNERTLRTYAARIEESFEEVAEFKAFIAGEDS